MGWWGKVLGGAFGFALGGPLGAAFGAAMGHRFDKGLEQNHYPGGYSASNQERTQTAFFIATFSVMGHIAKADGRVTEDEIALAQAVMREMALDTIQSKVARELFNQGKQSDFELDSVIDQFRYECSRRRVLIQMFIEIQLHAAYADGDLHLKEREILEYLASRLGFSKQHLEQLEMLVQAQRARQQSATEATSIPLEKAYGILGIEPAAGDADVKRAYRRMMSQHHPDKLVAKGLPEEMMKIATAQTQEIRAAYDVVKSARNMR